jgi:ABC-type cobalamin/Fe3+-siderophores transport system ATPase subunit
MKPDDRIALTGPNGSGKSTLIRHIMRSLNLDMQHVTYVPQEIDIKESAEIMNQARNVPNEKLGQMMTVVSRLGSRPHRLLESQEPSPGEIRKSGYPESQVIWSLSEYWIPAFAGMTVEP